MSLTKLSLGGNNYYSRPGRVWLVTSRLGAGKRRQNEPWGLQLPFSPLYVLVLSFSDFLYAKNVKKLQHKSSFEKYCSGLQE